MQRMHCVLSTSMFSSRVPYPPALPLLVLVLVLVLEKIIVNRMGRMGKF
jgi:hypothetical protein